MRHTIVRSAAVAALALACAILAVRALAGPFTFGAPVHSPLAAEGAAAIAFLAACLAVRGRADARPLPSGRWSAALALGLAAAAFWWALGFDFVSDDYVLIGRKLGSAQLAWTFQHGGGDGFYRPLGAVSLWFDGQWAAAAPSRWHAAGLGWHLANCALVFLLGRFLYGGWQGATAAALFGVSGARPEAAHWTAGRFDLLAAFFSLGALNLLLRFHRRRRPLLLATGLASLAAGLLSKEAAYAAPALLILLLYSSGAGLARRDLGWTTAMFALTAALFCLRWRLVGGMGGYGLQLGAGTVKALGARIWSILFVPVNWTREPEWWLAGALLLFLAALLFTAVKLRTVDRARILWLCAAAAAAAAPAAPLALIGADLQGARVLYLPSVPFAFLLAAIFAALPSRGTRTAAAAAAIGFNLAALEHNLLIWGRVAQRARETCAAAARGPVPAPPASVDGVYFFANGFEECVAQARRELSAVPQQEHGDAQPQR